MTAQIAQIALGLRLGGHHGQRSSSRLSTLSRAVKRWANSPISL